MVRALSKILHICTRSLHHFFNPIVKINYSTPALNTCLRNMAILQHIGNAWGVLRGKMPKIARAEAMARAELAWELIYKQGTTLKGDNPPTLYLGHLALLSLDSPTLTPPCYMSPPLNLTVPVASSIKNVSKAGMRIINQMWGILIPDISIAQCHSGTGQRMWGWYTMAWQRLGQVCWGVLCWCMVHCGEQGMWCGWPASWAWSPVGGWLLKWNQIRCILTNN